MLNKIILGIVLLTGVSFTVLAQNTLEDVNTNQTTGEQSFKELKPYRSSTNANGVDFRVLMPNKSSSKIMMENKSTGYYTDNNILFGKTVTGSVTTFWIEVTAYQMGATNGDLFRSITPYLLKKLQIDSTDGVLTFPINRADIQQFYYGVIETNNQGNANHWATYYLRERVRIPLTEKEFNAIRNHTHLGFQVETSVGELVPMVFDKKAWTSLQEKLLKLYEI